MKTVANTEKDMGVNTTEKKKKRITIAEIKIFMLVAY